MAQVQRPSASPSVAAVIDRLSMIRWDTCGRHRSYNCHQSEIAVFITEQQDRAGRWAGLTAAHGRSDSTLVRQLFHPTEMVLILSGKKPYTFRRRFHAQINQSHRSY